MAANSHTELTPIRQSGATNMITGNFFICREAGTYIITVGGGRIPLVPSTSVVSHIDKKTSSGASASDRICSIQTTRTAISGAFASTRMAVNEVLVHIVSNNHTAAQSSIRADSSTHYFTFSRIA